MVYKFHTQTLCASPEKVRILFRIINSFLANLHQDKFLGPHVLYLEYYATSVVLADGLGCLALPCTGTALRVIYRVSFDMFFLTLYFFPTSWGILVWCVFWVRAWSIGNFLSSYYAVFIVVRCYFGCCCEICKEIRKRFEPSLFISWNSSFKNALNLSSFVDVVLSDAAIGNGISPLFLVVEGTCPFLSAAKLFFLLTMWAGVTASFGLVVAGFVAAAGTRGGVVNVLLHLL